MCLGVLTGLDQNFKTCTKSLSPCFFGIEEQKKWTLGRQLDCTAVIRVSSRIREWNYSRAFTAVSGTFITRSYSRDLLIHQGGLFNGHRDD